MTMISHLTMTIDGKAVPAHQHFAVVNPSTAQVFAQAPTCTPEQLNAAMDAASRAFAHWSQTAVAVRQQALGRVAELTLAAIDELSTLLTREQGKPLAAARFEVEQTALWCRHFATMAPREEVAQDDGTAKALVVRRPLGVVAAITPWNFPLLLLGMKLAPALLAGNTLVIKPSPYTPLSTLRFGQIAATALPPGVLNTVCGDNALGALMTAHPSVRKISFTGSVATGKAVAASAAPDLKRCTLELGGNDAAIVLDDADPQRIAAGLFWGAFTNNGQVCAGIKRVYAPDRLHDAIVEALAARALRTRVGDGFVPGIQLGPVNNRPQFERVQSLVAEAVRDGAQVAAGGQAIGDAGYFFQPTILHGLREGSRIVDEEQFGPALPVMRYHDIDEAIERANASRFGLSGSVWSSDPHRAAAVAQRLRCGTAYVNTHLVSQPDLPFGGRDWSGLGVENGQWGLDAFCDLQVLYTPVQAPRAKP